MAKKTPKNCCPPSRSARSPKPDPSAEFALLSKALGHPIRIQILKLLKEKNACICGEIVDELPLAQSTVSQHLKVLKDAGFIKGEISGPKTCYCIDYDIFRRFQFLTGKFLS